MRPLRSAPGLLASSGRALRLDAWLDSCPRWKIAILATLLIALLSMVDLAIGFELSFSVFYLLPVALSTWYADRLVGLATCLVCAATWVLVDYTSGHTYSHAAIPFWNGAVRLGFFVVVAQLLLRLRVALATQQALAQRDALTGVPNRRTLYERYRLLAALAERNGQPLALGYMDIDGFKRANDTLGHKTGDEVLQQVAALVAARLRGTDMVGRLGGDEFVVLLPDADAAIAVTVFTDLQCALQHLARQRQWPIGFSIGVGVFHAPAPDIDTALGWADQRMYEVKRGGGNRVLVAAYPAPGTAAAAADDRPGVAASVAAREAGVV